MPGHPPHSRCAVCDDAYDTRFVCAGCRADPANAGWCESDPAEEAGAPIDEIVPAARLADLGGRRIRSDSIKKQQILQLIHNHTIRVPYRNRGRRRRQEPWVWRSRPLNFTEIAFLVGCTPQAVVWVVRRIFS